MPFFSFGYLQITYFLLIHLVLCKVVLLYCIYIIYNPFCNFGVLRGVILCNPLVLLYILYIQGLFVPSGTWTGHCGCRRPGQETPVPVCFASDKSDSVRHSVYGRISCHVSRTPFKVSENISFPNNWCPYIVYI